MLCLSVFPSAEAEENYISEVFPNGRHRLDLDWTRIGGFDGNTYVARPGYTYSYDYHLRFSARTAVMRVEFGDDDDPVTPEVETETGLGDSVFSIQYDPGAWTGIIGAGWLQEMPGNFWLVPDVSYMWSISHGVHYTESSRPD